LIYYVNARNQCLVHFLGQFLESMQIVPQLVAARNTALHNILTFLLQLQDDLVGGLGVLVNALSGSS
jgi:hypothetical protein